VAADLVIDTSQLNIHEFSERVHKVFSGPEVGLQVVLVSFGFKYGIPVDADLVADMRFLPNPHWVPELRKKTGQDDSVADYVLGQEAAVEFLDTYEELVDIVSAGYLREGKKYATVGIGCTGGKHRSVAMSEALAARLTKRGFDTLVVHRDLGRE
jgi:UPF0042 nucleotide-binding protein